MKPGNTKDKQLFILLSILIFILTSCDEQVIPDSLPGTYTGKERIIIRYDRGGQYIFRDDYVMVSLMIDSIGNVTGMVGEATLVDCNVNRNRGWISWQLGIKTDFLIRGMLKGNTFDKDTLVNKYISIPFNIENGELKGSLFMNANGDSFPIISVLKLQKR